MKSHINISGVSDDWKIRARIFPERFQQAARNPYYSLTEAKQKNKTEPVNYEWQLVDERPEKSKKDEVSGVFVADWQMDGQN